MKANFPFKLLLAAAVLNAPLLRAETPKIEPTNAAVEAALK